MNTAYDYKSESFAFVVSVINELLARVDYDCCTRTQPGHPSVGRRNEYWRWLRPLLGKKR